MFGTIGADAKCRIGGYIVKEHRLGMLLFSLLLGMTLLLGLSACGDSGSTTVSSFAANETTGKVILIYDLSQLPPAQDASTQIVSVRYNYSGVREGVDYASAPTQSYSLVPDAPHEPLTIELLNVPLSATQVTAAYYNLDGQLVAVGVEELHWIDGSCCEAKISEPIFISLQEATATLAASDYVLTSGQTTDLIYKVTTPTGQVLDLSAFATYEQIDGTILPPRGGEESLDKRLGNAMGVVPQPLAWCLTPWGKLTATTDPIYVTNQQVVGLYIERGPIEGQEVTVFEDLPITPRRVESPSFASSGYIPVRYISSLSDIIGRGQDTSYSNILCAITSYEVLLPDMRMPTDNSSGIPEALELPDQDKISVGRKLASFDINARTIHNAVRVQPLRAFLEYSDLEGQGPVPEPQEVTEEATFSVQPWQEVEGAAKIEGSNLVVEAPCGEWIKSEWIKSGGYWAWEPIPYKVEATYQAGEELLHSRNYLTFMAYAAQALLSFSAQETGELKPLFDPRSEFYEIYLYDPMRADLSLTHLLCYSDILSNYDMSLSNPIVIPEAYLPRELYPEPILISESGLGPVTGVTISLEETLYPLEVTSLEHLNFGVAVLIDPRPEEYQNLGLPTFFGLFLAVPKSR